MTASPRPTAPALTPDTFVGGYGADPKWGVLSEHLEAFVAAGGTWKRANSGSGRVWAVVSGKAYPVVCSDLIEIQTEDGRINGRCGLPVLDEGSCPGHAEERRSWLAATQAEVVQWERDREGLARTA